MTLSVTKHIFLGILTLSVFFVGCGGKKMSVEEAKKITVSMSDKSFSPPPRRIDDILVLLSQPGQFDQKIALNYRAIIDKSPPKKANDHILADFYLNRGEGALKLGHFQQALEDLRTAYHYAEISGRNDAPFLVPLATAEMYAGNYKQSIKLLERSFENEQSCSNCESLVIAYSRVGDLDAAEHYKSRGISICGQSTGPWSQLRTASMEAFVLEMRGKFEEAELHRRRIMRLIPSIRKVGPSNSIAQRGRLAQNLANQDKLIEAEFEIRRSLEESIGLAGIKSEFTGNIIIILGKNLIKQGRSTEAEMLIKTGARIMHQSGLSSGSYFIGRSRMFHGDVLADQGKFSEAMKSFDLAAADFHTNKYLYEKLLAHNPSLMLSLLKTGRIKEALGLISSAHDTYSKNFGQKHYLNMELRALRGMAYAKMNQIQEANKDFSEAVPILLNNNLGGKTDYSCKQRFKILIEAYIDLLGQIHGSPMEQRLGINAAAEAFRLADAIRGNAVRSALGASVVRAAVQQPDLSDLVRKEQDALNQISAIEFVITETLATSEEQQDPKKSIEKLMSQIEILSKARVTLQNEIKRRFPKYSELANPEPQGPISIQKHLRPGEALISVYSTKDNIYIWAISQEGRTQFKKISLSKSKLEKIVSHLRLALDPKPIRLGDIPAFDVAQAYELYSILLKPVERVWGAATDLLIVADGILGQLPFSVLPTKEVDFNEDEELLFSRYRKVPWLIRKTSITRFPSAASVISLRSLPEGDSNRKAFIGFGDPIFNQNQLLQAKKDNTGHNAASTSLGRNLHVRGIRITDTGSLDSNTITTSRLDLLSRLPDTAAEINEIAQIMGADPDRDVFLGKAASEHRVKAMNLSDRKVVAFATHALLPGDLDGLDQPALAFSSPSVTGEDDDGLLTAEEILRLKMNADWVVLSACNTGAADGAGAEAVSGLGRAFFYAGTRAILVSMWPVETTSAKEMTTGLFRYQKKDQSLSRARALRKSILDLLDGPGLKDDATNKIIASYAHPLFWAPFILVGNSDLRF